MSTPIRIGTRESRLAVWQATQVQKLLLENGHHSELVYIKSEGDIDLTTPLYEIGVQGIFTRNLDAALLRLQRLVQQFRQLLLLHWTLPSEVSNRGLTLQASCRRRILVPHPA